MTKSLCTQFVIIFNSASDRNVLEYLDLYLMDFFFQVNVVLRFYGPVNPMGSCRARSVYLTTRLLGMLSPLSG